MMEKTEKAKEYRERASRYLRNFESEQQKGDREKAGEALWGVVSCLTNALFLIYSDRPSSNHRTTSEFAKQFIVSNFGEDGERLVNSYKKVEKFHANFYHAFLDKDEFEKSVSEIFTLIELLDHFLEKAISNVESEIT
jgi:hypothetical protein